MIYPIPEITPQPFTIIKEQQEKIAIKFTLDGEHEYNRNFSRIKMDMALRKSRNTAPGPDNICYQMIRELPENVKDYLLEIYNKYWNEAYFLDEWRSATVIAFPKPDKDYSKAENYIEWMPQEKNNGGPPGKT